jgi:hypothetical protein
MTPNIALELMITCAWYQRRACWQASSLLQQTGDIPRLIWNVAHAPDTGSPSSADVCAFFRSQGLEVRETRYDNQDEMKFRGLVRNRQLAGSDADWVLFADCDMIYSPPFFAYLKERLTGDLQECNRCVTSERVSLAKQHSKDYFNEGEGSRFPYPCVIPSPTEIVRNWPVYQISRNIGAGYFQLARRQAMLEKCNGCYVDPDRPRDRYWITSSDFVFRRRIGGVVKIKAPLMYHLNHERDKEEGHHVTNQR